jgi:retron-type reverse transcriptase
MRHYLDALGGDEDTVKRTVIDLEKLILAIGSAEKSMIDRLKTETVKYKSDKEFYVSSMLGIARIYQYLPDIYSAKDIYDSILNGDYSEDQKEKTRKSYEELKKDFLEYR